MNIESVICLAKFFDTHDYDALINSKTINKNIEELKLFFEPIFQLFDAPYFTQAYACILLGLDSAAISLLNQWLQNAWFKGENVRTILGEAKAIVAIRNYQSDAGKSGARVRWTARDKTLSYTLAIFNEGNFKNKNQAAAAITENVFNYGKSIGFHFSNIYQAKDTIYEWLRKNC